ncbi:hypothetical protein ANO11243_097530 [Dothideomycetidae sp. 11243]|nr:hypothetical protein ANO11243_097530 [fungal sp. No.11243]
MPVVVSLAIAPITRDSKPCVCGRDVVASVLPTLAMAELDAARRATAQMEAATNAERILYAFTSRPDIVPSPKFAPIQTHPCVRGTSRVRHCGPPRHIFLTGGTGYFGFTLFHHFLQDDTLCQVTVIVRARSIEQARQCVIKLASIAGWWQNKYTARIRVWVGDLSRTHLGLSDSQLLELSGVGVNEQQAVDATCTTVLRSTSTTISTCGQSGSIKLKSPALLTAKFWSAVNADDLLAAITQNVKYLIRLGFFAQDWARSPSESVFGRTKERRHC